MVLKQVVSAVCLELLERVGTPHTLWPGSDYRGSLVYHMYNAVHGELLYVLTLEFQQDKLIVLKHCSSEICILYTDEHVVDRIVAVLRHARPDYDGDQ